MQLYPEKAKLGAIGAAKETYRTLGFFGINILLLIKSINILEKILKNYQDFTEDCPP
jgi:hypothetical protein